MKVPHPKGVFINAPFDDSYESLFVTLVGTLLFLGQTPHCVLEVREQGDGRLARIYELMRSCRVSMHDMSRVGTPVRFNMPFELGMASALKLAAPAKYEVVVLDAKPYRMDRLFSDYKGRDASIHHGTVDGMIACLLDTFPSGIAPADVRRAIRALRDSVNAMKAEMKSRSLFRPALFRSLTFLARSIARTRGFITAP